MLTIIWGRNKNITWRSHKHHWRIWFGDERKQISNTEREKNEGEFG